MARFTKPDATLEDFASPIFASAEPSSTKSNHQFYTVPYFWAFRLGFYQLYGLLSANRQCASS